MIRAGAIGAGVAGIALAIAGGVGLIAKPDAVVWASAPLDRAVVVIPPQVLAMDGVMDIVVEGEPWMETRTARPVDAYAWHRGESSIYVQGVSSWTEVKTLKPDLYSYDGKDLTGDIWRSNTVSAGATHIFPADVPAGLAVVVVTRSHGPLSKISIELSRDPGYGWAWPALSAGALLAAISMVLFALLWLDLRPRRAGVREVAESQVETTEVVVQRQDFKPQDVAEPEANTPPEPTPPTPPTQTTPPTPPTPPTQTAPATQTTPPTPPTPPTQTTPPTPPTPPTQTAPPTPPTQTAPPTETISGPRSRRARRAAKEEGAK